MGLRAQGTPGLELGLRRLCIAEPLVCAGKVGTCGRARALLPASSVPRLPPTPGRGRMGSSQGPEPCPRRNAPPAPGSEAGPGNKLLLRRGSRSRVRPGTEDVQAALVGALGELRQFSFSWFKKRAKPAKPALSGARHWLGRVWVCSGFALSRRLDPARPTVGTHADPRHPSLASTYRHQEPAAQCWKCQEGTLGHFRGDSGSCQRRGSGERAEEPRRLPPSPLPVTVTGRQLVSP